MTDNGTNGTYHMLHMIKFRPSGSGLLRLVFIIYTRPFWNIVPWCGIKYNLYDDNKQLYVHCYIVVKQVKKILPIDCLRSLFLYLSNFLIYVFICWPGPIFELLNLFNMRPPQHHLLRRTVMWPTHMFYYLFFRSANGSGYIDPSIAFVCWPYEKLFIYFID